MSLWRTIEGPMSVARSRDAVEQWLTGVGWNPDRRDDVSLVVSELVTNAMTHGRPPVEIETSLIDGDSVRVEVHDASPSEPRITDEPDGNGGHGLRIVDTLAVRWGWTPEGLGKVVWADLLPAWPM